MGLNWKNIKTNPPKSGTLVLTRYILGDKDEIRGTFTYQVREKGYSVGVEQIQKYDYLESVDYTWPFHYAAAEIYYIPVDELKNIGISDED